MGNKSKVYLVNTADRIEGARRCLEFVSPLNMQGKSVYVKPNFNTADLCPGSTHNDTLEQLLIALSASSPGSITIGERCGPGVTSDVLAKKGIPALCEKYGVKLVNFEELGAGDWVTIEREDLHWPGGLVVPRIVAESELSVATCCLKTHGFGGVFSMSLKLAVGMTPKDFQKLHGSQDMRRMIAEINLAYRPEFILMDAIEVFTDGGPMDGKRASANAMLISGDRVALDAVGLAILKKLGSNSAIMDTPIFEQEQIARAVELGLGVSSPLDIEIVTDDAVSGAYADELYAILRAEG